MDMIDATHTRWSTPGSQQNRLLELPSSPIGLADVLSNFLLVYGSARSRGMTVPAFAEDDRNLRTAEKLLGTAAARDARCLTERRPPDNCLFGTCRDFALLSASRLRESGVAARVRVGFASYLRPGCWEDHWVCEHLVQGRWAVLDASRGPCIRHARGLTFDVTDMPYRCWRPAASVWRAIRAGEIDPSRCGISFANLSGEWFVARSMLQDAAALCGVETLPWDNWGLALQLGASRLVTEQQAVLLDAMAGEMKQSPPTRTLAEELLERFPWARPTPTVVSWPGPGDRREVTLAET
jgi:hypothetical protein